MTDARTGLWNAYEWQQQTAALTSGMADRCAGRGPAVVIVDINRFKIVNDTYGHPAGDAVLQAVAVALIGAVRTEDVVARVGGDEFAVGLRAVTPDEVARLAERIRVAIGAKPMTAANGWAITDVSVSIGAAVSPLGPAGMRELLVAADRALYEAKASGRDAVRLAVLVAGTRDPSDSDGVVRPRRRSWARDLRRPGGGVRR
jgi:diguanylate cyclase (GGDEF)-like protein